ncbi:hypothetical protein Tco_0079685 [Tanacetum coccineum]
MSDVRCRTQLAAQTTRYWVKLPEPTKTVVSYGGLWFGTPVKGRNTIRQDVLSFGLLDVLCGVYVQYDTLSRLIKTSYSLSFENQIMLPLHFTYASANV